MPGKSRPAWRKSVGYNQRKNAKRRARHKRQMAECKVQLFALLGDACSDCGATDPRVLTVDHLNGDGAQDRRRDTGTSDRSNDVWRRYLRSFHRGTPLALRCFNCHAIKDLYTPEHAARVVAGQRRRPTPASPQTLLFP